MEKNAKETKKNKRDARKIHQQCTENHKFVKTHLSKSLELLIYTFFFSFLHFESIHLIISPSNWIHYIDVSFSFFAIIVIIMILCFKLKLPFGKLFPKMKWNEKCGKRKKKMVWGSSQRLDGMKAQGKGNFDTKNQKNEILKINNRMNI